MKIHFKSVSNALYNGREEVLRKIASTVSKIYSKYAVENDYTFNGKLSCYAQVAAYIRDNFNSLKATDTIYLYNSSSHDLRQAVVHACLYDENNKRLKDSFIGHPARENGIEYYKLPKQRYPDTPQTEDLVLLEKINLTDFFKRYFQFPSYSAAAPVFAKNDRVIVRESVNAWYTGTVTRSGKNIGIVFDDGAKATVKPEDFKHVKILFTPKISKKPFSLAQAKLLYTVPKAVKPLTKIPVPKQIKITLPDKPTGLPPHVGIDPKRKGKQISHELYAACGDAEKFEKSKSASDAVKLTYLREVYRKANLAIFGKRLIEPKIYFLKQQKVGSFRGRGVWKSGTRQIGLSKRLFLAGEVHVLSTLIHEMCHQAVTDIDKVSDRSNGGHGQNWIEWMEKAGIPPSRYDTTDAVEYMTEEEKALKHKQDQAKIKAFEKPKLKISNWNVKPGDPAQYYDRRAMKWVAGVVAGVSGTKMMFVSSLDQNGWTLLPNKGLDWLYELPEAERRTFLTPAWSAKVNGAITGTRINKENKARRKQMRAGIFTMWPRVLG